MTTDKDFFENNKILKEINSKTQSKEQKVIDTEKEYRAICNEPAMLLSRLFQLPTQANDYIIDGFLWKRQAIMIIAKDKVGKSVITMNMAANLTTGESFLGCYPISGKYKIVYVQCEGSREATKGHYEDMIRGGAHIDSQSFGYIYSCGLQLHTEKGCADLIDQIQTLPFFPDVVFIDPIYKAICGGDMSSSKDTGMFTKTIDTVKEHFNCAVVCCQHKRKTSTTQQGKAIDMGDEESFGSAFFKAYFDHTINMRKHKDESRTISCDTQRNGNVPKWLKLDFDVEHKIISAAGSKSSSTVQDSVYNYIKAKGEGSPVDIAKDMGINEQQCRNAVSLLNKKGKLQVKRKKAQYTYYEVSK